MADAELIAVLEVEHYQHYTQPPVLMVPSSPNSAEEYREFLGLPENSVWLAFAHGEPVGYRYIMGANVLIGLSKNKC